jgi:hypothetical protein
MILRPITENILKINTKRAELFQSILCIGINSDALCLPGIKAQLA